MRKNAKTKIEIGNEIRRTHDNGQITCNGYFKYIRQLLRRQRKTLNPFIDKVF